MELNRYVFGSAVLCVVLLLGCLGAGQKELTPVKLGLSWIHASQFAGEYYAQTNGPYEKEGLNVTLFEGSVDIDPIAKLESGEYDFAIVQPDALLVARENGKKLVAVATTYRISPVVYVSLKNGTRRYLKPEDLKGARIAVAYSEDYPLNALLRGAGLDPKKDVEISQRDYTFDKLYSGEIDVSGAWITDEVQKAKHEGIEFNIIHPSEYGVIIYADVLATTEDTVKNKPELVKKVVDATLSGWNKAFGDINSSSRLTLKYNPSVDLTHEYDVLDASYPLISDGKRQIGWMDGADWERMAKIYLDAGVLSKTADIDNAFTNKFVEDYYSRGG